MSHLYEIAGKYQELMSKILAADELSPEHTQEIGQIEDDIKEKAVAVAAFIKNLEAEADAMKEENEKKPEWAENYAGPMEKEDIDTCCSGCGRPPKGCQCREQVRLPKEIAQAFSKAALAKLGRKSTQH